MPQYRVMKAGWLTDGQNAAALRRIGETLALSERQAAYLLRSGQIAPVETQSAAAATGS